MSIAFSLNGRRVEVEGFDPHMTVLQFLRERGLTGTKEGCAEGECGACAVVLVRKNAAGKTQFEPINSCLLLLGSVADHELVSVEGVANGAELHPVQRAMADTGGSQCGYCTPGFVMSLFAEYYRPDRRDYDPEAISGNLCRCTGYRPIREAAQNMEAPAAGDPFKKRLALAPPELGNVAHETARGRFFRPISLSETFSLLAQHPKATLIAGGTDLVVEMNQRFKRFDTLISVESLAELREFEWGNDSVRIGAGLTLTEVEHKLEHRIAILDELFPLFSSRLIRNRATLGGNLLTASPIGDSPPALLALDAEVELASENGKRRVPLADFFTSYRKTRADANEVLTAVSIPLPLPERTRFYKVSKRVLDDISTVAAGFSLRTDGGGNVVSARLAYGGVAATPARALEAEKALLGEPFTIESVRRAEQILAKTFQPLTDHRGSADYRATMVVRLFEKFYFDMDRSSATTRKMP